MKQIWELCEAAEVPIPEGVMKFFDGEPPGDKPGAEVSIKKAVKEWSNEYSEGYELDLSKLPRDVKVLRFYNSW